MIDWDNSFLEFAYLDLVKVPLPAQKFGYFISLNYLTLIILVPLILFVQFYGNIFLRKLKKSNAESENEGSTCSILSKFQLAVRLPFLLSLFGFTLVFGVYLPLIVFLFVFLIFLIFWIDKIIFFNSLKVFSFESSTNLKLIIFSLPYFILFSVAVSIFSFGNFNEFPTSKSFFISKFDVRFRFLVTSSPS